MGEIECGLCMWTLKHDLHVLSSASFSPDGYSVVTASSDKTARIWSATTGECRQILMGHDEGVWSAVFSVDGSSVLTTAGDGTAKVWNTSNGKCMQTLAHDKYGLRSAVFSPLGS